MALQSLVRSEVRRFDVPGGHSHNFMLDQALAGGGAGSLRNSPLGKTFGQVLLLGKASLTRVLERRRRDGFSMNTP